MTTELLDSPRIDAFVHSQGVVWEKIYVPLELTYCDRTGMLKTFHIKSPISYRQAKAQFPKSLEPDAIVTVRGGTPYSIVLDFLKNRYRVLSETGPLVVFGYKGGSYQPMVLRRAGIPFVFNVDRWNRIPSIMRATQNIFCINHLRPDRDKCSQSAAQLVMAHSPFQ